MATPGEDVYCTLLMTDSYLPGAAVLAHSLRDAGTTKKLAVLVTRETLSEDTIEELKTLYDYIIPVEPISNPNPANLFLMGRPDLAQAFTKIALWRQTQFRKIVYLDADTVVARAPDELFDIQEAFAAAADVGWPDAFNSGVMVLNPNQGDYWALKSMAGSGDSFDGADQGLLNQYFENKKWHRMNFTYNVTPNAQYQWEPAYRYYKSKINVVHFIGKDKPWMSEQSTQRGSPVFNELLSKWWAVYDKHFKEGQPGDARTNGVFIPQGAPQQGFGQSSQQPWQAPQQQGWQQGPQFTSQQGWQQVPQYAPQQYFSAPGWQYQPAAVAPGSGWQLVGPNGQPLQVQTWLQPQAGQFVPGPVWQNPSGQFAAAPSWQPPLVQAAPAPGWQPLGPNGQPLPVQSWQPVGSGGQFAPAQPPSGQSWPAPPEQGGQLPSGQQASQPVPGRRNPSAVQQYVRGKSSPRMTTTEQPFSDPRDVAEKFAQGYVEPTPTAQQRKFSAPISTWDATRSEPPHHSAPEAINFPTQTYEFSKSRELFQPPGSKPKPGEKPQAIFPWERERLTAQPARVFADDAREPPAPVSASELSHRLEAQKGSQATDAFKPTSPQEQWQEFQQSNVNAWDTVPGIENYVRAIVDSQIRRSRPETSHSATGSDELAKSPPIASKDQPESMIITDFPSADERPSLPVTPAPVKRPQFWGEVKDEAGELKAAEGVPDQVDWVCPQCGFFSTRAADFHPEEPQSTEVSDAANDAPTAESPSTAITTPQES